MKSKGEREKYTQLNEDFMRIAKREAFFNEQCKEIAENNRMRKPKDLFNKSGDIKGAFQARMGTTKDRNDNDLTEAEEIKKR